MRCSKCGAPGVASAIYCARCGERLPAERVQPEVGLSSALRVGGRDEPEQLLWSGSYSPRAMLPAWIVVDLAAIAIVVAGALAGQAVGAIALGFAMMTGALAVWLYRRLSIRYRLTNQRLIHESGILWRVTNRIELFAIDDLSFEQGPIDRLLNVGDIHIEAHDSTDRALTLAGIEDVSRVFGLIDEGRRAEKLRRSISIDEAHYRHASGEPDQV